MGEGWNVASSRVLHLVFVEFSARAALGSATWHFFSLTHTETRKQKEPLCMPYFSILGPPASPHHLHDWPPLPGEDHPQSSN